MTDLNSYEESLAIDLAKAEARIEELERERDELFAESAKNSAKLAKATEVLHIINILDPEEQVSGCSPDALRGLVNLMGSNARTVLAELEGK